MASSPVLPWPGVQGCHSPEKQWYQSLKSSAATGLESTTAIVLELFSLEKYWFKRLWPPEPKNMEISYV